MKIAHVRITNFKRFDQIEIPIRNSLTKDIADQFLILGDNGTGKTTVLQAVGLCLSMASHRIRRVDEFDWLGWLPGRYGMWGTPEIEIEVHFTDKEIEATREAARRWFELWRPSGDFREPCAVEGRAAAIARKRVFHGGRPQRTVPVRRP